MPDESAWVPQGCALPTVDRPTRVAEFDALFATSLRSVERTGPTSARLVLDVVAEPRVRELARLETQCCSFFDFDIDADDVDVRVDVSVPAAHAGVLDGLVARAQAAPSVE